MAWWSRSRRRKYSSYWPEYVPVAQRKRNAEKEVTKLKKKGLEINPIVLEGRTIAKSFWGKAWCQHLESYSDFENRLPRGRAYVRNGSVVHLHIAKGEVNALVGGSSLYQINIAILPLEAKKWQVVVKQCAGKIDSLIELLQGKFSKGVMEIITHKDQGLFPHPNEIKLNCSCPDYAVMCKHVAAVLYGVGTRLDEKPEQLFTLRHVDHIELIGAAETASKLTSSKAKSKRQAFKDDELSALFDIDMDKKVLEKHKEAAPKKAALKKSLPQKATIEKLMPKKKVKLS